MRLTPVVTPVGTVLGPQETLYGTVPSTVCVVVHSRAQGFCNCITVYCGTLMHVDSSQFYAYGGGRRMATKNEVETVLGLKDVGQFNAEFLRYALSLGCTLTPEQTALLL